MVKYTAELDEVFKALASHTRREILHRLSERPRSVTELAEPLDLSLPAIHKHLKILVRAGLVSREKTGRINTISLQTHVLDGAGDWLRSYKKISSWTA